MSRTNVRKLATFICMYIYLAFQNHNTPPPPILSSQISIILFRSHAGLILNGLFVIGLAYSGCEVMLAVALLTISLMLHGSVSSGALASVVDISPNFAGVSLGINSTFSTFSGFISPIIVGYLTTGRQHNVEPWKYVFLICAAMQISCGIIYMIFSDSTIQPWNKPEENFSEIQNVKELKPVLKRNNKIAPSDVELLNH